MAANLSGMFQNLLAASQPGGMQAPAPTDPMQMDAFQKAGINDPLLQTFGRGLSGMLGTETRSMAAQAAPVLAEGAASNDPEVLRETARKLLAMGMTAQAAELTARAAQIEQQAIQNELAQNQDRRAEAQLGISQSQEERAAAAAQREEAEQSRTRREQREAATAIRGLLKNSSLSPEEQKALAEGFDAGTIPSETIWKRLGLSEEDRYKVVGNFVFDVREGKFIENPELLKTLSNKGGAALTQAQKDNLKAAADVYLAAYPKERDVAKQAIQNDLVKDKDGLNDYLPEGVDGVEVASDVEKWSQKIGTAGAEAAGGVRLARGVLRSIDELGLRQSGRAGIPATLYNEVLTAAGARGLQEEERTKYIQVRNKAIVDSLPPGVASDRDVELFSKGFPPENAGWKEIERYVNEEKLMHEARVDYAAFTDHRLAKMMRDGKEPTSIGNTGEWLKAYEGTKVLKQRLQDVKTQQELEAEIKLFRNTFGFVPAFVSEYGW